jgi:hypothetical protein
MTDWIVVYRNFFGGGEVRAPAASRSKEAALSLARSLMRAHYEVDRIEGPNGQVIGKEEIERWVAANPE